MWPNANLSYTIQPESYSLMNPMEFPLDYYGRLDLPGVLTFKGLMGGLTSKNDPANDPELYRFPDDANVQRLRTTPYMEAGIGIDNIFTCLRLDYVWRLTYRDLPNISRSGLRISLHFSF